MNKLTITRFPQLSFAGGEAINSLCTNLSFAGENVHKIMFTSCQASEGKSFVTMNVMRTLARLGKRVVLVDADLRRSVIVSKYGLQFSGQTRPMGLSHLLAGKANVEDVVYETNIPGAYIVPIGREISNSLPLLVSPRFRKLLDRLMQMADYVLVDAPPLGALIDAAEIAKSCDGSLVVVSYNAVRRQELVEVKRQLEQTGCPILGTVLNRVELGNYLNRKYYYKSYYKSYYAHDDDSAPNRRSIPREKDGAGKRK